MKKLFSFLFILSFILSLFGCSAAPQSTQPTQGPTEPAVTPDGLAPDKSYYQLTDKDGIVVRIPLGKPIQSGSSYAASGKRSGGDQPSNDGIYVFSEYSIISFGYGQVKDPITGEPFSVIGDELYSVPEEYVLILQYTNEYYQTVPCGSADAFALNIFVLDYKTMPGSFLFKEDMQLLCENGQIQYYFHRDTLEPGARQTVHVAWSNYNEYLGQWETHYSIQEIQEFHTPSTTYTVMFKETSCDEDGNVLHWTEYTYDDSYNVETMIHYAADGRVYKSWYDSQGLEITAEEYDENGNLANRTQTEDNVTVYESFDKDGTLTSRGTTTYTDDMDWISETQDFLNGSFTRNEFVKGELVKSIEYLQGRDGPYTVRTFSGENKFTEEYYAIGGTLVYRYEWFNGEIVSQWP